MLTVTMGYSYWQTNIRTPISHDTFDDFLMVFMSQFIRTIDEIQKTVIVLPRDVSRGERFSIHKLTKVSHFEPESFGEEPDRVMKITLSKMYVENIFRKSVA